MRESLVGTRSPSKGDGSDDANVRFHRRPYTFLESSHGEDSLQAYMKTDKHHAMPNDHQYPPTPTPTPTTSSFVEPFKYWDNWPNNELAKDYGFEYGHGKFSRKVVESNDLNSILGKLELNTTTTTTTTTTTSKSTQAKRYKSLLDNINGMFFPSYGKLCKSANSTSEYGHIWSALVDPGPSTAKRSASQRSSSQAKEDLYIPTNFVLEEKGWEEVVPAKAYNLAVEKLFERFSAGLESDDSGNLYPRNFATSQVLDRLDLLGLSDAEVFGTFEKIHGSKRGIERLEGSLGERRKELGERSTMTNVLKEMLGGGIAAEKSIPTSRGELAELIRADEASLAELKAGVNSLLQGEGNWNLSKVSERAH